MSNRSPKDPAGARELTAIVAGGLLVVACCAGPALLAAGVLGTAGGLLGNRVLVGGAVLAVVAIVGALALRRAGHRAGPRSCGPPPADSAASNPTALGGRAGDGFAEPLDRKEKE
jgi:hypothetical protein